MKKQITQKAMVVASIITLATVTTIGYYYYKSIRPKGVTTTSSIVQKEFYNWDVGDYYIPEMFDENIGHLEDYYLEPVDSHKTGWTSDFDYGDIVYPGWDMKMQYFPAFLAYDATIYTEVPEDILRSYFDDAFVEEQLAYRNNTESLISCIDVGDDPEILYLPAPTYTDISVHVVEQGNLYEVTYMTTLTSYRRTFEITNNGKVRCIPNEPWETEVN